MNVTFHLFLCVTVFVLNLSNSLELTTKRVNDALRAEDTITLYFISTTHNSEVPISVLKKNASIVIVRRCGANCGDLMGAVVDHLEHSIQTDCQPGTRNLIIDIGQRITLTYSYSGRLIYYNNNCYFNKESISSVVRSAAFLFQ